MVVRPNQRFLIISTVTNALVGKIEVQVAAKILANLVGLCPLFIDSLSTSS